MESSDEDVDMLVCALAYETVKARKRKRRFWVHDILKKRKSHGDYHTLVAIDLESDEDKFVKYFRLNHDQFAEVLHYIAADIQKHSRTREVICPRERLAVCIRYLATGESFASLSFQYRIGHATVMGIVREVCEAIWKRMSLKYMPVPSTADEWRIKAANFDQLWNFPHCIGAVDGKHIVMKSPPNSGSLFYNYKGTFSVILLGLVDANLQFTAIDVGSPGRNNDSTVFENSAIGQGIQDGTLNLPESDVVIGAERLGALPYVVVGDPAFALKKNLMKPYAGKGCPEDQQIFNYRLSRARRIVENAFGILAARWRVFHSKIAVNRESCVHVVKAACLLHNQIQGKTTPNQITQPVAAGEIDENETYFSLERIRGNSGKASAKDIRDRFKVYFNDINPLPWQKGVVRRGK